MTGHEFNCCFNVSIFRAKYGGKELTNGFKIQLILKLCERLTIKIAGKLSFLRIN